MYRLGKRREDRSVERSVVVTYQRLGQQSSVSCEHSAIANCPYQLKGPSPKLQINKLLRITIYIPVNTYEQKPMYIWIWHQHPMQARGKFDWSTHEPVCVQKASSWTSTHSYTQLKTQRHTHTCIYTAKQTRLHFTYGGLHQDQLQAQQLLKQPQNLG